jgi:Domain of unknown function DUF29
MSDLYEANIVAWAEEQAQALRSRSANQLDWDHLAEELEALVRSEVRAVTGPLKVALRHKLLLLGWPGVLSTGKWQHEVRVHLRNMHEAYSASMLRQIEPMLPDLYTDALDFAHQHMAETGAPVVPLPVLCPWTFDELLSEAEAALRWKPEA